MILITNIILNMLLKSISSGNLTTKKNKLYERI